MLQGTAFAESEAQRDAAASQEAHAVLEAEAAARRSRMRGQ
jgi:hypothetical protein